MPDSGPKWVNPQTGEVVEAELFVAVLRASSYVYAEAASQELSCWVGAHVRMAEYFGGSNELWAPDNLKSAVTYRTDTSPRSTEPTRSWLLTTGR